MMYQQRKARKRKRAMREMRHAMYVTHLICADIQIRNIAASTGDPIRKRIEAAKIICSAFVTGAEILSCKALA